MYLNFMSLHTQMGLRSVGERLNYIELNYGYKTGHKSKKHERKKNEHVDTRGRVKKEEISTNEGTKIV